jgi:long-chain acyl-CoA synthetase
MLVGARVLEHARADGDRPALRDPNRELTTRDIAERCGQVAEASRAWGLRSRGETRYAAMVVDGSADSLATLLALMMAGWAVGVLDPGWTDAERRGAIGQLSPHLLVAADEDDWIDCGEINGLQVARPSGGAVGDDGSAGPNASDVFYVGFTSGSSGVPKAFARTHASWWHSFTGLDEFVSLGDGTVVVPGPLSSSHFLFGALHGLHAGALVELLPSSGSSVARIMERLGQDEPVAAMYVVPTMLQQLTQTLIRPPTSQPQIIFCAGARLDQSTRDAVAVSLPRSRIVEYYGASELSFVAIRIDGDATPAGSVGRAFPGVDITIRDEHGEPCDAGTPGRIFVQSPLVFSGYRGAVPFGGAERRGDAWSVGDIGQVDEDGFLFVAGRGSSLIITGGANVQPEEVEQVLATVPGVTGCAVVGVDDSKWGQVPVAAITTGDETVRRADLRRAVGASLARHKRPRRYVVLDTLPLGRTGTIDRDGVRSAIVGGAGRELR